MHRLKYDIISAGDRRKEGIFIKLIELKQDLFSLREENLYYAHCISADFALGAGIAVQFDKRFQMREKLFTRFSEGAPYGTSCILVDHVFNLVTKQRYYYKPTLDSLEKSLLAMKKICLEDNITAIAMPRIGCGLDRLSWIDVKALLERVFTDTNIRLLVCSL